MSSIYNHDRSLLLLEMRIESSNYSRQNKDLMYKFRDVLFAEGLKTVRVLKYISTLNILVRDYNLDLKNATIDDLYHVVAKIERKDIKPWTKHDYKLTLKRFFRWQNGGEDPECTKWIRVKGEINRKIPEELLTESDIKKMILAATHLRDRAFIAVLYDSGARISEIGNLKLKHIVYDQYGAVLTIDGKTGMRRVRLVFSVPYLAAWIDMHPNKMNSDSFLWLNIGQRNHGRHMQHSSFSALVKRIAKKAGVDKRVYSHLFRHSRSTELAQHLTQAQMEDHLGWVHGSDMPRTYIHLSGRQIDDAILKIHGIVKKEDLKPALTPITCLRCEHINGPTSKFCAKCGFVIDISTAHTLDEKRAEISLSIMQLAARDPEVAKLLSEVIL